uniref:Reverse transcriptase domain-containing protein n=1 Tax=Leptobrachium leishanense TaxID=445787 RepID=A0A8C5LMS8_9ANUR
MLSTFNSILEEGTFHPSALAATISLLPKTGKDLLYSSSYRPISLLNADIKLLARVLANRLQKHLPGLVDPDQVGFIPGREARDATTRVINAICRAHSDNTPFLLLSTDAEKAFDRVLWPYLHKVLEGFGLGEGFLKWITALYSAPTARIRVNGALTPSFPIRNGTRQGCPLSPLLFALALEPLLISIRANPSIPGIQGLSSQHKISVYADDLMLFLSDPELSLPAVISELHAFGKISGLAINEDKSEILNVSLSQGTALALKRQFRFRWCVEKLKYLGVWICPDLNNLPALNYEPLLETLQCDLGIWTPKPLSWFGRIGVIKMNVLPRILYLIQTIPLPLPRGFLLKIRRLFLNFIWQGRRPRLKYSVMCQPTTTGGLAVPDIRLYYYASQLTRIIDWMADSPRKRWVDLEGGLAESPMCVLPWLLPDQLPRRCLALPTIHNTLKLWHKLQISHSLSSFPAPLLPISHNPAFSGGVLPSLRRRFTTARGLRAIHVLDKGQFKDIPIPAETPAPTFMERFNFAQIRHFLLSLPNGTNLSRTLQPFEEICSSTHPLPHSLSTLYRLLQSVDDALPEYTHRWDSLLGTVVPESHWQKTFALIHHGSQLTKLKETSFKLTALWYTTPAWIARFQTSASSLCWRCEIETGNYIHIWWSCPRIAFFWKAVQDLIKLTTDVLLDFTPECFLLSQTPLSTQSLKKSVLLRILLAARALVPVHWRQSSIPSSRDLVNRVDLIRSYELSALPSERYAEVYMATWFHWNEFISSSKLPPWLAAFTPQMTGIE